ncbi:MAG: hypothetical protein JKX97_06560 [Candidatus Lindowbacteria bacterium]|nr:hypothetical protein [Candidatus Lindowbacteria bacterium]
MKQIQHVIVVGMALLIGLAPIGCGKSRPTSHKHLLHLKKQPKVYSRKPEDSLPK